MEKPVNWRTAFPAILCCMVIVATAHGEGATRELPEQCSPNVPFMITVTIDSSPATTVVGLEDEPPMGWSSIGSISDNGYYDAENHKVKWGPIFAPNIPAVLTYSVTPPTNASGQQCFVGTASFDGFNEPIYGDSCTTAAACLAIGDADGDGRTDLTDLQMFVECTTGPVGPIDSPAYAVECRCLDSDEDGDIDLLDFASVQINFDG